MKQKKTLIRWTPTTYNRIAKVYDTLAKYLFPISDFTYERIAQDLGSGRMLDVACGTGTLLSLIDKDNIDTFGVDTSSGMLARACEKAPKASFCLGSYHNLPYSDESFEYVVETNAVGGVGIDAERILKEMLRVCKPEGEVQIVDYGEPPETSWQTSFIRQIGMLIGDEPKDFVRMFRSFGFEPTVEYLDNRGLYQSIKVKKVVVEKEL